MAKSQKVFVICDLSIASTKTKYIKLNTKTQNIFCRLNENLTTFLYTLNRGGTRKQKEKKVFFFKVYNKVVMLLTKKLVLSFTFGFQFIQWKVSISQPQYPCSFSHSGCDRTYKFGLKWHTQCDTDRAVKKESLLKVNFSPGTSNSSKTFQILILIF